MRSPSKYALKFKRHGPLDSLFEPYNAENRVWTSFSDQVGVQTHLMLGVGDGQAVRPGAQHSMAQLDQERIFRRGFLHSSAQRESEGSSTLNSSGMDSHFWACTPAYFTDVRMHVHNSGYM